MYPPSNGSNFWDDRILRWEAGRYDGHLPVSLGPAELLASLFPRPTHDRQRLAIELLTPFIGNYEVLEIGCGTGRMARRFIEAGCKAYSGIDHSSVAVEAAWRRHGNDGLTSRIRFEVRAANEIPTIGEEIVVSLGILDWLSDQELEELFRRQGSRHFFHSFSERSGNLLQIGHRFCRAVDRLLRPRAVRPRYMTADHLIGLMRPARNSQLTFYRDAALRYASFVSSLPLTNATLLASADSSAST